MDTNEKNVELKNMNDKLRKMVLPIGSVVMLKNGTKPVMIFGYLQKSSLRPGEIADYVGVPYPEGNLHVKAQFCLRDTVINPSSLGKDYYSFVPQNMKTNKDRRRL